MAGKECIIDDAYCEAMGIYFVNQADSLEAMLRGYVSILKEVKNKGIPSGETADALSAFIQYAERMKGELEKLAEISQQHVKNFLTAVDDADKYLF